MADANSPRSTNSSETRRPAKTPAGGNPQVGMDPVAMIRSKRYIGSLVLAAILGIPISAIAYGFLQNERHRRGQTNLTLPRVRAIIQEVLTAHFFMTQPHYLKWMLKLKEVELRK